MFDPFLDFEVAGYLRNVRKDKDPIVIKHFEHNLFRLNLPKAIEFLVSRSLIGYDDFLETHQILFGEY